MLSLSLLSLKPAKSSRWAALSMWNAFVLCWRLATYSALRDGKRYWSIALCDDFDQWTIWFKSWIFKPMSTIQLLSSMFMMLMLLKNELNASSVFLPLSSFSCAIPPFKAPKFMTEKGVFEFRNEIQLSSKCIAEWNQFPRWYSQSAQVKMTSCVLCLLHSLLIAYQPVTCMFLQDFKDSRSDALVI